MKFFWVTGALFGTLFFSLLAVQTDLFRRLSPNPKNTLLSASNAPSERDRWMNIFQNRRKIGFSHTVFSGKGGKYHLQETVFMRINTLGMVQDIHLDTKAMLNPDFTLSEIAFEVRSGLFDFAVTGAVSGNMLSLKTKNAEGARTIDIKIEKKPYLVSGILDAVKSAGLKTGETFFFDIFDPATMGQETVSVTVIGKEDIQIMGEKKNATIVTLNFKGAAQMAWIDDSGEVLKEEGLLGIKMEKTSRQDALFGLPAESSEDLTEVASVESNVMIENPEQLERLEVAISGISYEELRIAGGRQHFKDNVLVIEKESLSDMSRVPDMTALSENEKSFLKPAPFIQSDHEKIRNLAKEIVSPEDSPAEKVSKIMGWIHENIEKRPVLSLPDAISTLENRMGDCNEHSVLFAALARAAGIPAKVEAGLVYLRGRFYYHAWNLVYAGRWITADSLFGQFPADVTHIRFSTGDQQQQLDLMGIIGKVKLEVRVRGERQTPDL
jgi:hypothetical protein